MPTIHSQRSALRIFLSVQFALWFRELKTRYSGSGIGWAWAVLGPLATVAIFTIAAGVRGRDLMFGIDYPVYVMTGLIPFRMATEAAGMGLSAVQSNSGLFIYRQVKPFDVIFARVGQTFLIDSLVLVLLTAVGGFIGFRVMPADPLRLLALWLLMWLFSLGLALNFSVVQYFAPEAGKVLPLFIRPLVFISGVFIPMSSLPPELQIWMIWNPFLHFTELIRSVWFATFPLDAVISWPMVIWSTLVAMALGLAAHRYFRFEIAAS